MDSREVKHNPIDTPTNSAAGTAQPRTVLVEKCVIISVYPEDYTVDARSELTHRFYPKIAFMTPYCNQANGEGINFMPEVGATCWVCRSSEQNRYAFVLGWTMVDEEGSYRGGRELLNPGDIQLSTRDGNFVTLRRGGILQIGATPICQRIYIPVRNMMQDFSENYEMHTPAGDLTWMVLRAPEDGEGHQRCEWTLAVKEFADDPNENPISLLKIGSHGDGNDTILTLQTRDKGGGAVKFSLEITKAGELKWTFEKLTLEIKTTAYAKVVQDATLEFLANLTMTAAASISLAAQSLSLAAQGGGGSVSLGAAGATINGNLVNLGDALFNVLRNSPDFALWVTTITTLLSGTMPGQPVLTLGPGVLIPPMQHISPKVKG
jgi:hypothetical protein